MKKLFLVVTTYFTIQIAYSQSIGIGANTTPDPSAVLDVNGTTKGFLAPRMTNTQRGAIPTPAIGLLVYQTNNGISIPISTAGLYVNLASGWKRIATADEIVAGTNSWTVSGVNQFSSLNGNVGIGHSVPTAKLDVLDKLNISDATHANQISILTDAFGKRIEFYNNGEELSSISGSQDLVFSTKDHVSHLRLWNTTGNITTSSGSSLDVDGHGNTNPVLILDDDSPSIEFKDGATDRGFLSFIGQNMVLGTPASNTTGGLSFRTQNSPKAYIDENGKFGIGTVSPEERLHLKGNVIFEGTPEAPTTLYLRNEFTEKGFMQLSGDNLRLGTVSSNNLGKFVVRTNGVDRMTVDQNGDMAIGIDPENLNAKFAVYGKSRFLANGGDAFQSTGNAVIDGKLTVNKALEAVHIEGNDPAINFFEAGDQRGYLWFTDNIMNLGTSNTGGKIQMQTEQVTIGTSIATPSTYKLGVGGRIICEELKVKLQSAGWPDYVFANNYKLKPLEELENYIKINQHLPNIPAAKTVETEGLEVGEMQRRMMEKIEELTLYVIDLKKEIEVLKVAKRR